MKAEFGSHKQHHVEPKDPWEMLLEKHALDEGRKPNARWLLTASAWFQMLAKPITVKLFKWLKRHQMTVAGRPRNARRPTGSTPQTGRRPGNPRPF
jgi:hypothetical protein